MVSQETLENSVELALTTLAVVASSGTNDEKVRAATALLQGVGLAYEVQRKEALSLRVLPLVDAVTKNLSGTLRDDDNYAPAFALEPTQQASLLTAFVKELK
ncbi:hypothetical protein [Cyanobium sp. BA5m-10]|uniref:hypothetical protein n=1 Tax=Cyanobium sp. BA5m-10 TaxID=2823705 RepID=UPI0020CD377A|nr:hypothetical protein [Cyanobium sp. BA5m-10]